MRIEGQDKAPGNGAKPPTQYIVVGGETADDIARRFGVSPEALRSANMLMQLDRLEPGRVIKLPAGAKDRGEQPQQPVPSLMGNDSYTPAPEKHPRRSLRHGVTPTDNLASFSVGRVKVGIGTGTTGGDLSTVLGYKDIVPFNVGTPPAGSTPVGLLSEEGFARLKDKIGRAPYAAWWQQVQSRIPASPQAVGSGLGAGQTALDAAFAYRLTGEKRYLDIAAAALHQLPQPQGIAALDQTYWVNSARPVQRFAEAYTLVRGHLAASDDSTVAGSLAELGQKLGSISLLQSATNQSTRSGGALGSLALALWGHPAAGGQEHDWLTSAYRSVGLGMHSISADGINAEGPTYAAFGDEVAIPFLRQAMAATGENAFLEPALRAHLEAQSRLRLPTGDLAAIDDGHVSNANVSPLLVDPRIPAGRLARREVDNGLPLTSDLQVEALAWFDDSVAPDPGPVDGLASHIYGHSGAAVFRSSATDPQAVYGLFTGQTEAPGHVHITPGNFQLAAFGQVLTNAPAYPPGGDTDQAMQDFRRAQNANMLTVDGQGPSDPRDVAMRGGLVAPGLAGAGVDYKVGDASVSRQFLFLRDRYFVVIDQAHSSEDHEYQFNLQGFGDRGNASLQGDRASFQSAGVRLDAHVVTAAAPELVLGDGRDARFGQERPQPRLTATQRGQDIAQATILAPTKSGDEIEVLPVGAEHGVARRVRSRAGLDLVLVAGKEGTAVADGVSLTGTAAVIEEGTANRPAGLALTAATSFHGRGFAIKAGGAVDLSLQDGGSDLQGAVAGPRDAAGNDIETEITIKSSGLDLRSVSFKGSPIPAELTPDGLRFRIKGQGTLALSAGQAAPTRARGSEPLVADRMDNPGATPEDGSLLRWLATQPDPQAAMSQLPPAQRERLQTEVVQHIASVGYDALLDAVARGLGMATGDLAGLASALTNWAWNYDSAKIAGFGAQVEAPIGDASVKGQVAGGYLLRSKQLFVSEAAVDVQDGQTAVRVQHDAQVPTDGGKYNIPGPGPLTADRLQIRQGPVSGFVQSSHSAKGDALDGGASLLVKGTTYRAAGGHSDQNGSYTELGVADGNRGGQAGIRWNGDQFATHLSGYQGRTSGSGQFTMQAGALQTGSLDLGERFRVGQAGAGLTMAQGRVSAVKGSYQYWGNGARPLALGGALETQTADPSLFKAQLNAHAPIITGRQTLTADMQAQYDSTTPVPGSSLAGNLTYGCRSTHISLGTKLGGPVDGYCLQELNARVSTAAGQTMVDTGARLAFEHGAPRSLGVDLGVSGPNTRIGLQAGQDFLLNQPQVQVALRLGLNGRPRRPAPVVEL